MFRISAEFPAGNGHVVMHSSQTFESEAVAREHLQLLEAGSGALRGIVERQFNGFWVPADEYETYLYLTRMLESDQEA